MADDATSPSSASVPGSPVAFAEVTEEKSGYAHFCQMLKHPSAKPLVGKAARFVTSFPEGLSRQAAADKVRDWLSRAEDFMLSDVVVFQAECDAEGLQNATEGLEKFLLSRLYPKVFAVDRADQDVDDKLQKHISGLAWVELEHLGIPPVDSTLLPRAISELRSIDTYKAPHDKLVCVLNSCRVITDILKRTHAGASGVRALSADDFLPLLIYLVIKANPLRLHSNAEYVAAFRHPSRLNGEAAYFTTTLLSAKEFLIDAGAEAFDVTPEDYSKFYAAAQANVAKTASSNDTVDDALPAKPVSSSSASDLLGLEAEEKHDQKVDKVIATVTTQSLGSPIAPRDAQDAALDKKTVEVEHDSDEVERVLFSQREVWVYQIPPAASSAGHKADDWKTCIFKGPCRVFCKGKDLSIKLIDASSGQLFAQCNIPGGDHTKYVEPVTDSSRYFVLRITNGNKHAFIGLGFEDRNDSFDFKCSLSDFKNRLAQPEPSNHSSQSPKKAVLRDLSLKDGDSLRINLKAVKFPARCKDQANGRAADVRPLVPPPAPCVPTNSLQSEIRQQVLPSTMQGIGGLESVYSTSSASPPDSSNDEFDDFGGFQSSVSEIPASALMGIVEKDAAVAFPNFSNAASPHSSPWIQQMPEESGQLVTSIPQQPVTGHRFDALNLVGPESDPFDPFAGLCALEKPLCA